MSGLPLLPAIGVEFFGSAAAILLSLAALYYARALVRLQPQHFIWDFLYSLCIAMTIFALSRAVGHIVRIILVFEGRSDLWKQLSPFSGGLNTMLMISAAAVIIYYPKGLAAFKAIRTEAEKLAEANTKLALGAQQLTQLNSHLEEKVLERTRNLSESEKKFRNFFENSQDLIYFCDHAGNITNINSSGLRLLGFDEKEQGINFHSLFDGRETLDRYLHRLAEHGSISDFEITLPGRSGVPRTILLTANTITNQAGEIIGYEGIGKDMTRLQTMTDQLINQEKMASIGQIAAGVAHEINTPLGIILGYAQLMMDDFAKDSENHTHLQVIERQTKTCRRIVTDLLKFSRQSSSIKAEIDVNRIIEEVLSITEHTLNIGKITVRRNFAEDLPKVFADGEKLQQVFINLFNNSQYAMRQDGGELLITTAHAGHDILITIQDSGEGIDEKIMKNIFDPFFTTKEVGIGTGLGLSVTYGIIQEHGGTISVESPIKNRQTSSPTPGAAFSIRLPITSC